MSTVLRVCFIHEYEGSWHIKLAEIYAHSLVFDELVEQFDSLEAARKALLLYKPDVVKLSAQEAGELWG